MHFNIYNMSDFVYKIIGVAMSTRVIHASQHDKKETFNFHPTLHFQLIHFKIHSYSYIVINLSNVPIIKPSFYDSDL